MAGGAEELAETYRVPLALAGAGMFALIAAGVTGVGWLTAVTLILLIAAVVAAVKVSQEERFSAALSTVPVSDEVRRMNMEQGLTRWMAATRGRVESVTPYSAVVVSGQRVNHILHLLISVLLCGLWLPVWFLLAVSGGEKRRVLSVDQCGNVTES